MESVRPMKSDCGQNVRLVVSSFDSSFRHFVPSLLLVVSSSDSSFRHFVPSLRLVVSSFRSVTVSLRFVERLVVSSVRLVTPLVVSSLRCCVSSFRSAVDHCARLGTRKSTIRIQMIRRGRLWAKMAEDLTRYLR